MNANEEFDYENIVQSALRSVVKDILKSCISGLSGSHHFYISFSTIHPEVIIPEYLRQEYPDEITIVLQYEFWDLEVNDSSFSVTLCFDESNERLTVPFEAITNFVDPSSKFGLQFTPIVSQEKNKPQEKPSKKASIDEKGESISNVITLDTFRKK